jgi:hypothetical protein
VTFKILWPISTSKLSTMQIYLRASFSNGLSSNIRMDEAVLWELFSYA